MATEKSSSITVHPPHEPEIVIDAGIVGAEAAPSAEAPAAKAPSPAVKEAQPTAPQSVISDAKASQQGISQPAAPTRKSPAKSGKSSDYTPTTLEDLKGSPMGLTQKIIIVLAIVALIAFIIWYSVMYVVVTPA